MLGCIQGGLRSNTKRHVSSCLEIQLILISQNLTPIDTPPPLSFIQTVLLLG